MESTISPKRPSHTTLRKERALWQRLSFGTTSIASLLLIFQADVELARRGEEFGGPWGELLRHGTVVPIVWLVLLLGGTVELLRLLRCRDVKPYTYIAFAGVALFVLTPWFSAAGWLGTQPNQVEGYYWPFVWFGALVFLMGIGVMFRPTPEGSIRDMSATLMVVVLLGFLPSFGLQMRCTRDVPGQEGAWLLLVVLLVTKVSDIGAYFIGSAFGKHKLAPQISPGKSVEGAIGGMVSSMALATVIALGGWLPIFHIGDPNEGYLALGGVLLLGLFLSLAGQIGDLIESCFKRDAGMKDSAKIIPGFGGILDLIDSPLLALPVGWFFLTAVLHVL